MQLIALCELCGRPSTKECYVCTIRFCEFCTRRPHWRGRFGLHYPMANCDHMVEKLGRKQLEKKRLEDGDRSMRSNPNFRTDGELREARAFKEAAALSQLAAGGGGGETSRDAAWRAGRQLSRYCKWAQSGEELFVALYVPTGYADRSLKWEIVEGEGGAEGEGPILLVQAEDSAPLLRARLAGPLAVGAPAEAHCSEDNRMLALSMRKGGEQPRARWRRLFCEDSAWGADRAMQPPYTLAEGDEDVILELPLPRSWEAAGRAPLEVSITEERLRVEVCEEGGVRRLMLERVFWTDPDAPVRRSSPKPVDPALCTWALTAAAEGEGGSGCMDGCVSDDEDAAWGPRPARTILQVHLVKPPLTSEQTHFSKGKRDDNRCAGRQSNPGMPPGARFFVDDADDFFLEDVLQALCFRAGCTAFVTPIPSQAYGPARARPCWATRLAQLAEGAQKQYALLCTAESAE